MSRGRKTNGAQRRKNRRRRLWREHGDICFYCGERMERGTATIEHLHARSSGGKNEHENVVLAHWECNMYVGNKSEENKRQLKHSISRRVAVERLLGRKGRHLRLDEAPRRSCRGGAGLEHDFSGQGGE